MTTGQQSNGGLDGDATFAREALPRVGAGLCAAARFRRIGGWLGLAARALRSPVATSPFGVRRDFRAAERDVESGTRRSS
jgi:hypothetical protein